MKGEKFTYGYVDCVISMMASKEAARELLRVQLYDMRNELTKEHYFDMYEYISARTALPIHQTQRLTYRAYGEKGNYHD